MRAYRRPSGWRQKLIREIREHAKNGVPYDLTFAPTGSMTKEQKHTLQNHLRDHFHLWRDTWIMPWIDLIEEAIIPKKKPDVRIRRSTTSNASRIAT